MNPVSSHQQPKREINGQRPSQLRINKESHLIHKPSSSLVSNVVGATKQQQQQRQPVIIYAHSPKVIHTQARDFMALVQKLTGLSRSDHEIITPPPPPPPSRSLDAIIRNNNHDDNDSSSALTDDNCGVNVIRSSSSLVSPTNILNPPNTNQYFADIPLFTPNSTSDLFCSPRPAFRFPDSGYASPNMGNSMSPSVLEFIKGLPEY